MAKYTCFAASIWLLVNCCQASPTLTNEEIDTVTTHHNLLRSQVDPPAANMNYMTWNAELAVMAERWAEECIWEHGDVDDIVPPFSSVGQNLFLAIGVSEDSAFSMTSVIQAWYNEIDYYDWDTKVCTWPTCGHYKQVTWAKSGYVGCGTHFCPYMVDYSGNTFNYSRIVVCNYENSVLSGNPNPYISGSPCTQCVSGSGQCYENLCRPCSDHNETCECNLECFNCGNLDESNCTCSCADGWMGHDCSEECADQDDWCNTQWFPNHCPKDEIIPVYCPLMCGVCNEAPPEPITCASTEATDVCTNSGDCKFDAYMNLASCLCECDGEENEDGYCINKSNEEDFGVEIYFGKWSKSQWLNIKSDFFGAVVLSINLNCGSNLLEKQCCLAGDADIETFMDENGVILASGYPKEDSEDLIVKIMALTSCLAARYRRHLGIREEIIKPLRKSRENFKELTSSNLNRMIRSSSENDYYLDKTILYEAIKEYRDIIEDTVSVTIIGLSKEEGVMETLPPSSHAAMSCHYNKLQLTICLLSTFYYYY